MVDNNNMILSKVRLERAKELVAEAKGLLEQGSYKSANNRAFYAMEKGIKALLVTVGAEPTTHSGILKQFNLFFIHQGDGSFNRDDYIMVTNASRIRSVSDYDDFYIANKAEAAKQVEDAELLVGKVEKYLGPM